MTAARPVPKGRALLANRYLNKGTAFTADERVRFELDGLLPPAIEDLDLQLERVRVEYTAKTDDLERHIFLRALQQTNSVLFYRFLSDHLAELLPIVYTPTVGHACLQWSRIFRREHGLYLSWPDRDRVPELLDRAVGDEDIDIVVVTDGERVLGLGDLGVGGMGIPIGKLSLYTAVGGIDPARTLPVMLDAGTNTDALLSDPLYLGWRSNRVREAQYDELVDAFVDALSARFPAAVLQWEDFAQVNATRLLARHRQRICSFNDDIQGTAAVTAAAITAGMRATRTPLTELRLIVVGAGSAGTGIAHQVTRSIVAAGLDHEAALRRCWMVDRDGLLHDAMPDLHDFQADLARPIGELAGWDRDGVGAIPLEEVVRRVAPHALVGVSGQPGLFTERVIRDMAERVEHPIVLPLSNPTPRAEAVPADIVEWTDGRAMIGTGSPFPPVSTAEREHSVAQVNNVHIFPGVGLGALASRATQITDGMLAAAADAISGRSPAALDGPTAALVPPISASPELARHVGLAVAQAAVREGVADLGATDDATLAARLDALVWAPEYKELER